MAGLVYSQTTAFISIYHLFLPCSKSGAKPVITILKSKFNDDSNNPVFRWTYTMYIQATNRHTIHTHNPQLDTGYA